MHLIDLEFQYENTEVRHRTLHVQRSGADKLIVSSYIINKRTVKYSECLEFETNTSDENMHIV